MLNETIRLLVRVNRRNSIDPQHVVFALGIVILVFVTLKCVRTTYKLRKF